MIQNFLTFQKFNNPDQVNGLIELLKNNNIEYQVEEFKAPVDLTFVNNQPSQEYSIKLRKEDFGRAKELLSQATEKFLQNVDKDHFLFDFSDEELIEIVNKPDEWGQYNFHLAKKILKDRGKEISQDKLNQLNNQRIDELAQPEKSRTGWVIAGYMLAILGGIAGFFIGYLLWNYKKTLPNGDRVYAYSESDRRHGRSIFFISVICITFWVIRNWIVNWRF